MHMDRQPSSMNMVGNKIQLLKNARVHHADDEVQAAVAVRYNGKQCGFPLAKRANIQLVMAHKGSNLRDVEFFQPNAQ